jgi:hypothetical protein
MTFVPYIPTNTHERVTATGITTNVASADVMFRALDTLFQTSSAVPLALATVELHAPSELFYPHPKHPITHIDDMPRRLIEAFQTRLFQSHTTPTKCTTPWSLAFPDEGAMKRYRDLVPPNHPCWLISKQRNGDEREILSAKSWNMTAEAKANVLILDDMIKSGKSIFQAFLHLVSQGCGKISLAAVHAVFPRNEGLKFAKGGEFHSPHLDAVFVTDSLPHKAEQLHAVPPFVIVSVVPALVESAKAFFQCK